MSRRRAFLAAGLALPLLLACSRAGAPRRERVVLAGSAAQNLLVLPLNLTVTMPEELDAHSDVVWEELEIYLRDHGKRLKTAAFRDAHRLWLAGIQELRAGASASKAGFDDAARLLVKKLAEHAEFDTVIIPSLFVREAPIRDQTARWDGVERSVEIEAIDIGTRKAASEMPLEGNAPATSLHVVVLDARGNKIQEAQGGLDLLVRVRALRDPKSAGDELTFRFSPRSEVFADRAHVREGIALALSPFVPVLPPQDD